MAMRVAGNKEGTGSKGSGGGTLCSGVALVWHWASPAHDGGTTIHHALLGSIPLERKRCSLQQRCHGGVTIIFT
jgi:hypothetical protein